VAPRRSLGPAHRGYEYQDLLIATRLVDVLLGGIACVAVDHKETPDDVFDHLTVVNDDGLRARTQFKHRDDGDAPLALRTFTTDERRLRLDRLVASAAADRASAPTDTRFEFRLVLSAARPDDGRLGRVLKSADSRTGRVLARHPIHALSF
jgi:hypothetical protein